MKFIIGLFIPFVFFFLIKGELAILQIEHYEVTRYLKHGLKRKMIVEFVLWILLVFGLISEWYIFSIALIASLIIRGKAINNYKVKVTNRIKRFAVICYVEVYLLYIFISFDWLKSILVLNNFLLVIFLLVHLTSSFLEKIILNKYKKEAQQIIKNKTVVGITGSYGKTSCKNIIYDMLEQFCNVSKTPKSYNTKVGIIKSIRENVNDYDDVFICEYGVDRKKGMNKLLKVIKPNISLITEVGPQHLLTFKNIENIVNEKIKLALELERDGIAVINNDNKYLKEKIKDLKSKVITYGINNDAYITAKNIVVNKDGSCFELYINNKKIKRIKTKLLGTHNVLNLLGSIGVLFALKIDLKRIDELALNVKQVEHRLELKNMEGYKIIDDSFNSNEVGFKMAIDILALMKEEKIVITPGVVEQGKNSDNVNFILGQYMSNKVDFVILVEQNYKVLKEGLLSKGFDEKNILIRNNFIDAWEYVKNNIKKENKIILIENDLPNIYLK